MCLNKFDADNSMYLEYFEMLICDICHCKRINLAVMAFSVNYVVSVLRQLHIYQASFYSTYIGIIFAGYAKSPHRLCNNLPAS